MLDGLKSTHKTGGECDTGIAYLVSDGAPSGWRTNRMTKIYDLGRTGAAALHPRLWAARAGAGLDRRGAGRACTGPSRTATALYFAYGTGAEGRLADRGPRQGGPRATRRRPPPRPTARNLLYPQIGPVDTTGTAFPILGISVPHWAPGVPGRTRDFALLVSESLRNECQEVRQLAFMVDVTTERTPFSVATFEVPDPTGDFCRRGGRFGPHSSNESFSPIYYGRLAFIAYFNAGVRAVDVRDPFHPTEAAFYIPSVTAKTDKRCIEVSGAPRCKTAIQTNNVDVDDRGFVYLADRADTGLHIVERRGRPAPSATSPGDAVNRRFIDLSVTVDENTLSPPSTNMKLEGDASPPRPRLLAGLEREPEPAHRRPYRLAAPLLQARHHHRRDHARAGDRRGVGGRLLAVEPEHHRGPDLERGAATSSATTS